MGTTDRELKNFIPLLAIVTLIALASLQTISSQEDTVGNFDAVDISAQSPCNNITQHLENKGLIGPPYKGVGEIFTFDHIRRELGGPLITFAVIRGDSQYQAKKVYVDCDTGDVYAHPPSAEELGIEVPPKKLTIALNRNSSIIPDYLDQVEETGAEVLGVACRIDTHATRSQIEIIKEYEWPSTVDPMYPLPDISSDRKILMYVRSTSTITSDQVDQVKQTGADVSMFICWILANGTESQRGIIEGYEWVMWASDGSEIHTADGASEPATKPKIVLLANSIDYNLASDFFGFLQNKGRELVHVNASNFDQHSSEKFVVILGGPDAPEGVGEIVQQILDSDEQDYLRTEGNRKMYVKSNVWAQGQVVMVIAGPDRYETQKAHEENRWPARLKIMGK